MVKKFLRKMTEISHKNSKIPWASFEISDVVESRIKVEFRWNKAFIEKIYSLGFQAETEEESVMLFYYASQMKPDTGDEPVNSLEHPNLRT